MLGNWDSMSLPEKVDDLRQSKADQAQFQQSGAGRGPFECRYHGMPRNSGRHGGAFSSRTSSRASLVCGPSQCGSSYLSIPTWKRAQSGFFKFCNRRLTTGRHELEVNFILSCIKAEQ